MIKWFLYYKWLEIKEFVDNNFAPVLIVFIWIILTAITGIMFHTLGGANAVQSIASGILSGMALVFIGITIFVLFNWLKKICLDNIVKAKRAIREINEHRNDTCPDCGSKLIIVKPKESWQTVGWKCTKCSRGE